MTDNFRHRGVSRHRRRSAVALLSLAIFTPQNIHRLMGGHSYYYFIEYQPDIEAALQDLRQREFEAGRYNPAQPFPRFPIRADSPAPGAKHESIYEAIEDAAEDGT